VTCGTGLPAPLGRPRFALAAPPQGLDDQGVTVATSNRITLAAGQVTPADKIVITLARAAETPDAIMIHWPAAPSVTDPNPKALASIATSIVRILAEAQARLAKIGTKGRRP
jgi:hypothetical protein